MKFKRLVEKVTDTDYSVIDHTLAKAERSHDAAVAAYEDKVKKLKLETPDEDRDAHQDIKTTELKKLHLTESLFELVEEVDARPVSTRLLDAVDEGILDAKSVLLACLKYMSESDIASMIQANELLDDDESMILEDTEEYDYRGLSGIRFNRRNVSDLTGTVQVVVPQMTLTYNVVEGVQYEHEDSFLTSSVAKLRLTSESVDMIETKCKEAVQAAVPNYSVHVGGSALVSVPSDVSLIAKKSIVTEGIDSNNTHAEGFIKALRSAGFGDGFDQKLKIDEYQTGTRVEYTDQGGHFVVTITDDKVTLEGHDEGEEPFKKEFTTWADFAKEFQDLYPGIPVHECNKMLAEAKKIPGMINNYEREDGARYLVYKNREPLAYVIEAELTSGEVCYLEKNGHVTQSVMPHKDYPVSQVSVQWDEWEMPYVKVWGPSKEYFDEAIKVAEKYGKEYEIHTEKFVKGPRKFWLEIIVDDEDTEEPYVDPDAPVVNFSATKDEDDEEMTGRHMKDNEDLEDSQRYPIESPQPAQTGLAMMESLYQGTVAFIDVSGSNQDPEKIKAAQILANDAGAKSIVYFADRIAIDPKNAGGGTRYNIITDYMIGHNIDSAIVITDEDIDHNADGEELQKDPRVKILRTDLKDRGPKVSRNTKIKDYVAAHPDGNAARIVKNFPELAEDLDASNIDHYEILNWLSEHEQAEADAKAFFAPTELYDLTSQELVDWICEHDQLCADFYEEFKDLLTKEDLTEDVMMNGALNEVRISTEGIRNFRPWGGAVSTFNNILEAGKMDEFEKQLEATHSNGIGSTELNDLLWFSKDDIYRDLGMTEYMD